MIVYISGEIWNINVIILSSRVMICSPSTQSTRSQLNPAPLSVDIQFLEDFYMTDPISRASQTMAKCIAAVKDDKMKNNY